MNENDDVMDFDEPAPQPINEPDLPSTEQTNSSNTNNEDDYSGYEGFEAASENDFNSEFSENQNEINNDNSDSSVPDTGSEEQNENTETYEESQSKKILDKEPSIKQDPSKKKNEGLFLQRNKIITIIMFVLVALLLFFALVMPSLKTKKKKKNENEVDKAGINVIPNAITKSQPYSTETNSNFENGNSALSTTSDEDFDSKYPPILEEKKENIAPVQVPSSNSGSSTSDFPVTNRNEQQKQLQRLSLSDVASPTQNQKGGAYYGEYKPTGYNTGYNSGYSGTSTGATYTPQNLTNNLDKFLAQQQGYSQNTYQQQNNQTQKNEFLNKNGLGGNYKWNSDYSLWKGTIISAVLDTGINTDLPGSVMAHVTKNIYSSQDGKYLLIPQGSRLYGEYNSDVSYGQNRVQVVWNTLIRPDGLEINLGSMNGIDAYGFSGYKGWTSNHPFEYLKAFGLIAMYSILDTKANNLIDTQKNAYAQNAISDVYNETKKLNNKIVDRALDIQPTNTIQSGKEINLITNVTIDLPPLEPYEVEEKYVRQ